MKKVITIIFVIIFLAQLAGAIWFFLKATKVINTQGVLLGQTVQYLNAGIKAELLPSFVDIEEGLKPKPVTEVTEETQ